MKINYLFLFLSMKVFAYPISHYGLEENPYKRVIAVPHISKTAVCGILPITSQSYRLKTFESTAHALAENAFITHSGHCGYCSSIQDLQVYLTTRDLTTPSRKCALKTLVGLDGLSCFEDIGFSRDCAKIWHYNTINTKEKCLKICLRSFFFRNGNNRADGTLDPCLQCDEDESGPIFQLFSGRTRRNSNITSAIKRPDDEISFEIDHSYLNYFQKNNDPSHPFPALIAD